EVEAVVRLLHGHPVAEGADEMAEVQAAGRPHAGDDARFGRHRVGSQERMKRYGGSTIVLKPPVRMSAYKSRKPYGRRLLNTTASEGGRSPARTLPPSSGGIG